MINSVNSLSLSLLSLIKGINSKTNSLFFGNGIFIWILFPFSSIIIWLLYILSFNSSNITSNELNCKKYLLSLISSNEYLPEYDFLTMSFFWTAVTSIMFSNLNNTLNEFFLLVFSSISNIFYESISASSDINFFKLL